MANTITNKKELEILIQRYENLTYAQVKKILNSYYLTNINNVTMKLTQINTISNCTLCLAAGYNKNLSYPYRMCKKCIYSTAPNEYKEKSDQFHCVNRTKELKLTMAKLTVYENLNNFTSQRSIIMYILYWYRRRAKEMRRILNLYNKS